MADDPRTNGEIEKALGQLAATREWLVADARAALLRNPKLVEALNQKVSGLIELIDMTERDKKAPVDQGLMDLVGLSDAPPDDIDGVRYVPSVPVYDDQISRERLLAIADLYYLFQMEQSSVFRSVLKLQELFRAGTVRLSDGEGAVRLFRFDRHSTLRYTLRELVLSRFSSGLFRAMFAMKERTNGKEIHR